MAAWNALRWTPEQDEAIRKVYERGERGGNFLLAQKWKIEPRNISARAAKLGFPPLIRRATRGKPIVWRESEIELVCKHSGEPAAQIRARLYAKGCSRSLPAIRTLVFRLRKEGKAPGREEFFEEKNQITLQAVATGLGTREWVVEDWIKKGWLKTRKRPKNTIVTIRYHDLRKFLIDYVGYWDHRKADRFFMVDVLTNQMAEKA